MRCLLLGIAGFSVAAIISIVAVQAYGDFAARASLAATLLSVRPVQARIANMIAHHQSIPNTETLLQSLTRQEQPSGTDYFEIIQNGTIIVRSAAHGQIVILTPIYQAELVTWQCIGSKPEQNLPTFCRSQL